MKYIGKSSLSFFMELILVIIMIANIAVLISLPWNIEYYLRMINIAPSAWIRAKNILMIILYPCGISSLMVAFELKKIFRTLVKKDPFVQNNVHSLKTIGFAMTTVTVFLFAKIFLMNSLMTMLGAFASILMAVFCFVLADVFQQAVYYKQDNELTI
ncbi:MAG: DUF2975 domain-containing protein [Eubacteriales bacterium]